MTAAVTLVVTALAAGTVAAADLAKGAGAAQAAAISDADLGYLRGLYHMTADATLRGQQDDIAYQMKQTLGGH